MVRCCEAVGQEKLHVGALRGDEWMDRFAAKHCVAAREIIDFPKDWKWLQENHRFHWMCTMNYDDIHEELVFEKKSYGRT